MSLHMIVMYYFYLAIPKRKCIYIMWKALGYRVISDWDTD